MSVHPEQEQFDLVLEEVVVTPLEEALGASPKWSLPPYSGKDRHCVKCGADHAVSTYHASGAVTVATPCYDYYVQEYSASDFRLPPLPEHIDRRCTNCSYGWIEDVLSPEQREELEG